MNLGEWLPVATARLHAAPVDAPSLVARVVAAHVLLRDRAWVLAHPEAEVPDLALEVMLQRLESQEPLAYVIGHREFYGLDFEVNRHVLIPRQETETLVQAVLDFEGAREGSSILDIGTGSGCIAISLKHTRPDLIVTAIDLSPEALAVAQRNAEKHEVDIEFLLGDGVEAMARGYDIVVTNPPYVAEGDPLGPGVGEYEPHLALYSGGTGLEFYERISANLNGILFTEVGDTRAAVVWQVFESAGHRIEATYKDLLGIDRVLRVAP